MKTWVFIAILLGLTRLGFVLIPEFGSYLAMMGLISFLVIAHELGHFYVAKKVGVKVERFGFGLPFGPTLYEKKVGETTYCVHALLLGGYVGFPDDDPDNALPADSPLRFENKSIAARAAIAVAGVAVNFVVAYALMVWVIGAWGYPGNYHIAIDHVLSPKAPAAIAGVLPGDILLKAGDTDIKADNSILLNYLGAHKGQPAQITVERAGKPVTLTVIPNANGKMEAALTITHKYEPVTNPFSVLQKAFSFLSERLGQQFVAMGDIFTQKRGLNELSGPIGIIKDGGAMIQRFGLPEGLTITALISAILAVMNILPIPMLDGGHLLFMLIELIKGSPVNKRFQERVIQASFLALMGLMVFIMWNDIHKLVSPQ